MIMECMLSVVGPICEILFGIIILIIDWFSEVHVLPLHDAEVLELALPLPHPDLMLLVVVESLVDQTPRCLQLQTLVDDVVEDVNEGVLGQPVRHLLEMELEGSESLGDLTAEGVGLLLILLEGRNELAEQPTERRAYGFYEARSNPNLLMSTLLNQNLAGLYCDYIKYYTNVFKSYNHAQTDPSLKGKMQLPYSTQSYLFTECAIFIHFQSQDAGSSWSFLMRAMEWVWVFS